MPLYMYQASFTAKSMADHLKEPQDPVDVIRPALDELGARAGVRRRRGTHRRRGWNTPATSNGLRASSSAAPAIGC